MHSAQFSKWVAHLLVAKMEGLYNQNENWLLYYCIQYGIVKCDMTMAIKNNCNPDTTTVEKNIKSVGTKKAEPIYVQIIVSFK